MLTALSVLTLIRESGADAPLEGVDVEVAVSTDGSVAYLEQACGLEPEEAEVLGLWAQAGAFESFEALDAVLTQVVPGGWFKTFTGRRRRLREGARRVLEESSSAAAVRLAIAVIGAVGDRRDVPILEELAIHPALCHYAVTALAILGQSNRAGKAALLRLLNTVRSAERVIVIDRLLSFVREATVRFALVRDGLVGMEEEHAREVADDIYASCHVEQALNDPAASPEVRAGAELVMRFRRGEDDTGDDTGDDEG